VATLTSRYQYSYYHWLFEVLPRFALIENAEIRFEKIYIQNKKKFQKQALELMGYEEEKIIDCDKHNLVSSSKIIATSFPGVPGIATNWACKFLQEKFIPLTKSFNRFNHNYKKLYISRDDASIRKIFNEAEIVHFLKGYNFYVIRPGELDFIEQVDLFQNAEIVIGPHGAGLSNIVFCKPGTKIVEIFSSFYVNPCYWYIAQEVGLEYYYVIGDGDSGKTHGPGIHKIEMKGDKNINVDLNRLKKTIDLAHNS
jgi:capsular polysaccharide biosynthesis protein